MAASKAASLSPRHEALADGSQRKGPVFGASPPPTTAYAKSPASYRVASHSPPQTHRATRATVPATPALGVVSLRPRSPVQNPRVQGSSGQHAAGTGPPPATSRVSLTSSVP